MEPQRHRMKWSPEMDYKWQRDLEFPSPAGTAFLPPPTIEETGWDILLALRSDRNRDLNLDKLASIASAHHMVLARWLSWLEDRRLIVAVRNQRTGELRAVLTSSGRELLDRYLSALGDFEAGTHH
jgi:predicted DNA-binding protein (MmcQ/YjbR family)